MSKVMDSFLGRKLTHQKFIRRFMQNRFLHFLLLIGLLLILLLQFFQLYFPELFSINVDTQNSKLFVQVKYNNLVNRHFWLYELLNQLFSNVNLKTVWIIYYVVQGLILSTLILILLLLKNKCFLIVLILIFVGGSSNFITRLWSNPGVKDYFSLPILQSRIFFNLEDVFIGVGIMIGTFNWIFIFFKHVRAKFIKKAASKTGQTQRTNQIKHE